MDDVDDVVEVLDEVATWMSGRGIAQWPPRFAANWVWSAVEAGETWLVVVDNHTAATITLSWEDPLWDLETSAAGQVHGIAVRRFAGGLGVTLLDWVQDEALRRGRPLLRLDCVADNQRLRAYYQAARFLHRGDVEVRGAPGLRDQAGPRTLVSRYERASPTVASRQVG